MKNKKKLIKVAIDSPAAAGAGTLARAVSKHYNLLYLDTGKIYRLIAFIKINQKKKFNKKFLKKRIQKLNLKSLQNKNLLSDEVGNEASLIAKDKYIRELVYSCHDKIACPISRSFRNGLGHSCFLWRAPSRSFCHFKRRDFRGAFNSSYHHSSRAFNCDPRAHCP